MIKKEKLKKYLWTKINIWYIYIYIYILNGII